MYFITHPKADAVMLGIHHHKLYAFGKEYKKLVIYEKDVFDAGDWSVFYKTEFKCSYGSCLCFGGLAVAAGIIDGRIWVIGKGKVGGIKDIYTLSINIITKDVKKYRQRLGFPDFFSGCSKCNLHTVSIDNYDNDQPCFLVAPNSYGISGISLYHLTIQASDHSCFFRQYQKIRRWSKAVSNVGVGTKGQVIYAKNKRDGLIAFCGLHMESRYIQVDMQKISIEDMVFFRKNEKLWMLARAKQNDGSYLIKLQKIRFYPHRVYACHSSHSVILRTDASFPLFGGSQVFSDRNVTVFSTSSGIVTIVNRMLTLSESAYISLLRLPNSLKTAKDIKSITLIRKIINTFLKSKDKLDENWMSFKHIKAILGLPNDLFLKHEIE